MATALISNSHIASKIYFLREARVMLSTNLALLYRVEPRSLVQAVKRNSERFPSDFMFQLTPTETRNLKSQFVISSWGGRRAAPYAFTEQGVAMLSSILRSDRAVQVNIAIMRAFVQMRRAVATHEELRKKIEQMERGYDAKFEIVFTAIKQMLEPRLKPKLGIGFHAPLKSPRVPRRLPESIRN